LIIEIGICPLAESSALSNSGSFYVVSESRGFKITSERLVAGYVSVLTTKVRWQGIANANAFATRIERSPIFQLVVPPTLSLVVFRLLPSDTKGVNDAPGINELNELNLELLEKASKLFLTRTDLGGSICIRMSTGGYRTEEQHVVEAFETLEREAQELMQDRSLLQARS
jgi:glutamate/tyrosine decarboxylase-like PLP-dependent enzyme